jgi:hypothetical protein
LRLAGFFVGFGSGLGGSVASIFLTASSKLIGGSVIGLPAFPLGLGLCAGLFMPHILALM